MTVSVTDAESKKRQVNPLPILYCSLDNMKEQSTTGVLSLPLPNLVANSPLLEKDSFSNIKQRLEVSVAVLLKCKERRDLYEKDHRAFDRYISDDGGLRVW